MHKKWSTLRVDGRCWPNHAGCKGPARRWPNCSVSGAAGEMHVCVSDKEKAEVRVVSGGAWGEDGGLEEAMGKVIPVFFREA